MPEMHKTNGGYLATIYSTTFSRAQEITKQYGGTACQSMEEALTHPDVKAAYIATPHTNHMESTITALKMGIPVLCEKPFAVNMSQSQQMINVANTEKVYLQEGMWTRHNPVIKKALEWIETGRIGNINSILINTGGRWGPFDPKRRIFDADLAGGALLDIGVYALAISKFIFNQQPKRIESMAEFLDNGVDKMVAVLMQYSNGGIARLFTSSLMGFGFEATIQGEHGDIIIPHFVAPTKAELMIGTETETYIQEIYNEGFAYEFDAAMDDIRQGRLENELVTHTYTLDIMETMDAIRNQIGLRYPME